MHWDFRDTRVAAIATGAIIVAAGYHFGMPAWFSVISGIVIGAVSWLCGRAVRALRSAATVASDAGWSAARRRYLLSMAVLVGVLVAWATSLYLHLLAQGEPPTFVQWLLAGGSLALAYALYRSVRENLTRAHSRGGTRS